MQEKVPVNSTTSGYERLLKEIFNYEKRGLKGMKEQKAHQRLKWIARDFLNKLGYSPVQFEEHFGNGTDEHVIIDVTGQLGENHKVGVECGGIGDEKKLRVLASLINNGVLQELYVLPYGESQPYKWDKTIKVCWSCGHRVG